jgi:hypothetical protein
LAKTESGVEFYLVEATPDPGVHIEEAEELLKSTLRKGDATFSFEGRVYIALPGDVRGAGHATRRILRLIRNSAIPIRTRLIEEPWSENLSVAAFKVVSGEVPIWQRAARDQKGIRKS